MSQATGEDILTELLHQLGFGDILDEVLDTTAVTTVMMPYASALFSRRIPNDRPRVLPGGSENFAFLGQFTDLPEDIVFTVEYSVHAAMHAVYNLWGVPKKMPPIYHGLLDPRVGVKRYSSPCSRNWSSPGARPCLNKGLGTRSILDEVGGRAPDGEVDHRAQYRREEAPHRDERSGENPVRCHGGNERQDTEQIRYSSTREKAAAYGGGEVESQHPDLVEMRIVVNNTSVDYLRDDGRSSMPIQQVRTDRDTDRLYRIQ